MLAEETRHVGVHCQRACSSRCKPQHRRKVLTVPIADFDSEGASSLSPAKAIYYLPSPLSHGLGLLTHLGSVPRDEEADLRRHNTFAAGNEVR